MASFFWLNDNEVSAPDGQKLTIFLCIAIKKSWGKNHGNFGERACFLLSRLSVASQPVDREGCGGEMFAMFSCHLNNCLVFRKKGHLWITSILVINCCWQTIPKHSGLKWQFSFSSSLTILLPGLGSAELFLCLSCWCHLPVSLAGRQLGWDTGMAEPLSLHGVLRSPPPRDLSNWPHQQGALPLTWQLRAPNSRKQ